MQPVETVCLDDNQLSALAGGLLADPQLAHAERHLDDCLSCQELLAALVRNQSPRPGEDAAPAVATAPGAPSTADAPLPRGSLVGRYVVLTHLGAGGMGVVYAAYDPELERTVALKLLRPGYGDGDRGHEAEARMLREARSLARVSHPNVIAIHDVGRSHGQVFLAMERVAGGTLRAWVRSARPPLREVLARFRLAGLGLSAVHAAGLVHRDFKADNVLLTADGRVLVTDFGLARVLAAAEPPPGAGGEPLPAGPNIAEVTRSGALVGTPAYMAPEQLRGEPADARADQFSFCVALYEALYGVRPFRGRTVAELRAAIERGAAERPPRAPGVPTAVVQALLRGLAASPADRFPSMRELLAALSAAPRRRLVRVTLAAAALAAAASAVAVPYYALRVLPPRRCQAAAREQVRAVLGQGQSAAIERAFGQSGLAYAQTAAQHVASALREYVDAWSAMQSQVCVAQARHEQSAAVTALRSACLDQRLRGLGALVDRLQISDPRTVERSAYAVAALDRIADCGDLARLPARVRLPTDGATQQRVEALRAQVAEAQALLDTGWYSAGLQRTTPLAAQAQQIGFRPLQADVQRLLGSLHKELAEYPQASEDLLTAVYAAEAGQQEESAARASIGLVDVAVRQAHYADAHLWLRHAEAAIERLGGDEVLTAWLENNHGNLLHAEGKYTEALLHHQRALALRRRIFGAFHTEVAMSLNNLGATYSALGRYREAAAQQDEARQQHEHLLGPEHPAVAGSWLNLGQARGQAGDIAGELQAYEHALAIWQKSLPADHLHLALVHHNLGSALSSRGEHLAALSHYAQARAIKEKKLPPGHPSLANTVLAEGEALRKLGRLDAALRNFQEARATYERALGLAHPLTARAFTEIGSCELLLGHAAAAVATLQRALQLHQKAEAEPEVLADTQFQLAQALWRAGGDRQKARTLAEAAGASYARAEPGATAGGADVREWLRHPR